MLEQWQDAGDTVMEVGDTYDDPESETQAADDIL